MAAEPGGIGKGPPEARVNVGPGLGITRSGEDVTMSRSVRLALGDLPVILRLDHADALSGHGVIVSDAPPPEAAPAGAGGAMTQRLRPEQSRVLGGSLGEIAANRASGDLPHAAVLIAQPIYAEMLGRPIDPCAPYPPDDAYIDLQRIDGARLALYLWPSEMVAFDGGPDYSLPADSEARRNRLAYAVFDNERLLAEDEMHPWEAWGLPLAVIGFGEDWALSFVDRGAVVRSGGTPGGRSKVIAGPVDARLWQAQLDQFTQQLRETSSLDPEALRKAFVRLPPVGLLPSVMFDPALRRQRFFGSGFEVSAVPVAYSNLNLVVTECAALAPID